MATGTALAAESEKPDLRVSINFTQPVYKEGEQPTVAVSVTNVGSVAATSLVPETVQEPTSLHLNRGELGPIRGLRVEPGQTVTANLSGYYGDQISTVLTFTGTVMDVAGDANEADNHFSARSRVEGLRGDIVGGVKQPNEQPLVGVQVEVWSRSLNKHFGQRITDEQGRFTFHGLPAGEYQLGVIGDWSVRPGLGRVHVYPRRENGALLRPVQVNDNDLSVAVAFQRDSYAPGEQAQAAVTLTNKGGADLVGVRAACTGGRDPQALTGEGAGWGELDRYAGKGVTAPAGQSVTVTVSERVPEAARKHGYVELSCGFSNGDDDEDFNHPWGSATAKVPGMTGDATTTVVYDRNHDGRFDGEGVAGAELVLTDALSGAETARVVTDAAGRAELGGVPAGYYRVTSTGMWRAEDEEGTYTVLGGDVADWGPFLVRPKFVRPATDR